MGFKEAFLYRKFMIFYVRKLSKNIQNNICLKQIKGIKESCKQIQKESEKPKHKVRAKVEHMFALIKTTMKQESTRYIGLLRNNLNFTIVCIAANLKLFAHKQIKLKEVKNRWKKWENNQC